MSDKDSDTDTATDLSIQSKPLSPLMKLKRWASDNQVHLYGSISIIGVVLALVALFYQGGSERDQHIKVDEYTRQLVESRVQEYRNTLREPSMTPSEGRLDVDLSDMPDAISNGFKIGKHSVVVDFNHYKKLDSIDLPYKKSAVIQYVKHQVVKLAKADHFRAAATTSGLDVYIRSNYPHTVFANDAPDRFGEYRVKKRIIEFDVSDVPVGSEFTIEHQKTYWNAFQGDDQSWAGYEVKVPTSEIEYLIIFPEDRPYKNIEFFANDPDGNRKRLERESYVLEDPDKTWLWWRAVKPEPGMEYNVDWDW